MAEKEIDIDIKVKIEKANTIKDLELLQKELKNSRKEAKLGSKEYESYSKAIVNLDQKVSKLAKDVKKEGGGINKSLGEIGKGFQEALGFGVAGAVVMGVEALKEFGAESVKAFQQSDLAAKQLQGSLENAGQQEYFGNLTTEAEKISKQFHFTTTDIEKGQSKLLDSGKVTVGQIEKLSPLISDYARKTGKSWDEASEDIVGGLNGQGKALKRYGVDLSKGGTSLENYNSITEGLTKSVKGQAEIFNDSSEGGIAAYSTSVEELQVKLGKKLMPIVGKVANFLSKLADNFGYVEDAVQPVIDLATDLGKELFDLGKELGLVDEKTDGASLYMKALGFSMKMTILPIKLLIQTFTFLVERMMTGIKSIKMALKGDFKGAFDTYTKETAASVAKLAESVKRDFTTIVDSMTDNVKLAGDETKEQLKKDNTVINKTNKDNQKKLDAEAKKKQKEREEEFKKQLARLKKDYKDRAELAKEGSKEKYDIEQQGIDEELKALNKSFVDKSISEEDYTTAVKDALVERHKLQVDFDKKQQDLANKATETKLKLAEIESKDAKSKLDIKIKEIEHKRDVELQNENLTADEKKLITETTDKEISDINKAYQQKDLKAKLDMAANEDQIELDKIEKLKGHESEKIDLLKKVSADKIAIIQNQMAVELQNTDLTESERAAIIAKYNEEIAKNEEDTQKKITDDRNKAVSDGIAMAGQFASAISSISNSIFEIQSNNAKKGSKEDLEIKKKQFKTQKALGIVSAGISTAQGIMQALAGTPPPASYVMAALNGAMGVAQIAAIASKKFDGGPSATSVSTPAIPSASSAQPSFNAPQFFGLGQSQMAAKSPIANQKVYVTQTDITNTQNKVKVIDNRSTLGHH